jgi:hypothetical protein
MIAAPRDRLTHPEERRVPDPVRGGKRHKQNALPARGGSRACLLALVQLLVLTASCTTYRGVSEFTAYRDAYSSAADVGNDILDRLAVAERSLYQTAHPLDPKRSVFDPKLASYFVDVVDPPATASYRRTLSAVQIYNDGLHGLASGEEAAALAGKITRLSAIGANAAADVVALAGAGPASGATAGVAAATAVNTVLAGLEPITAQVFAFETRRRFREQLLDQAPTIRRAIQEVRQTTPDVFDMLRTDVVTTANLDPERFDLTEAERKDIGRTWSLIATWVVLLDASLASLDTAVAAVEDDAGMGSFDGVLLAGEQLSGAVHAARQNLAGGD